MIKNNDTSTETKDIKKIRVNVDSNLWNIFKAVLQLRNVEVGTGMNEAIKLWIKSDDNTKYSCNHCKNRINRNDLFIKVDNGVYLCYCSLKCFNAEIKESDITKI